MDEFDIKLLNALQADGRLTNNELADRIGYPPRNVRAAGRRWKNPG